MSGQFPDLDFVTVDLSSKRTTFKSSSQSERDQARSFGGHRWQITVQFPGLYDDEARILEAFCDRQDGRAGIFTLVLSDRPARGTLGGTPVVNGGGQSGRELAITGASLNVTGWMRVGDLFLVAGSTKVHRLTEDADTNGSGQTTLHFSPDLVISPSNGAALTVEDVPFTVRMTNDLQKFSKSGLFTKYELDVEEAL